MTQITGGPHRGHAAGDTDVEKAASQLVSDVKYEVKKRLGGDVVSKMAPAALLKAYIQQLNKSESGPVKNLAQKKLTGGGMREDYNIDTLASSSVANALFKVFVEGVKKEEFTLGEEYLEELMKKNKDGEPLYSVKVYYKNGTTYTRWSSREDMSRIRSNPNVKSIEMVDYMPPQDQQGSRSSKDYDGDRKVESGAKEYRGSVHNAIQRKKGGTPDGKDTSSVKEDFDFFEEEKSKKKDKKFDVMRGKKNEVKLFPETTKVNEEVVSETSYSKFLNMIQEKTLTAAETAKKEEIAKSLKSKYGKTPKTYAIATSVAKRVAEETACDSSVPQRDTRGDYAKTNVIKNKLRSALGVKNPIVMVSNEEDVKEGAGLSVEISKAVGGLLSNPRTSSEQGAKNFQKNVADPIGKAVKGAVRAVLQPANMSPEAQKARRDKYRPEEVELKGEVIDEEMPKRARKKPSEGTATFSYMGIYGRKQKQKKEPLKRIFSDKKDDDGPDDNDPRNHPSLSARERNPNLK